MLEFKELSPFFKALINYIGNGYTYYQVSYIPQKKAHKKAHILAKLSKKYNTQLTKWQRQYRKRKGLANYQVFNLKSVVVVLKTPGEDETGENWQKFPILPVNFGVLELEIIKDERDKITVKISKNLLKEIKANIREAFKKRDGRKFHYEMKKLYNLHKSLKYRGIMLQISDILREIQELKKKHTIKWEVPKFF
jgi:hypothetical protein